MTRPCSNDLRKRVVRTHLAGETIRSVAARRQTQPEISRGPRRMLTVFPVTTSLIVALPLPPGPITICLSPGSTVSVLASLVVGSGCTPNR